MINQLMWLEKERKYKIIKGAEAPFVMLNVINIKTFVILIITYVVFE